MSSYPPIAVLIDEWQALVGMEELSGSVGTLEQKVADKEEKLLVCKWVQQ